MNVYIYIYMYIYVYVYIYMCMYIYICVCIYIYVYVYIYMYSSLWYFLVVITRVYMNNNVCLLNSVTWEDQGLPEYVQ